MDASANIRSIEILEELRSTLLRYKDETLNALQAASIEINRACEWLQERLQYWQNELRRRRRALEEVQAALRACQLAALAAGVASAGYAVADCSLLEAAVMRAKRRVEEAEQELRTVQAFIKMTEEAIASYQRQAQQLATMMDNDLLKASKLLRNSTAILLSYVAGNPGTITSVGSNDHTSYIGHQIVDEMDTTTAPKSGDRIYVNCKQCGGSGTEEIECNPCGGTGQRSDRSSCPHCNGLGKKAIQCWRCSGTGTVPQ